MKRLDLRRWGWTMFVVGWVVTLGVGLVGLWSYKLAPGAAAAQRARWPVDTSVPRAPDGPTLIVFLHPQCPCSLSTLAELERVLPSQPRDLRARILFYTPDGEGPDWPRGRVWESANAIPGAMVLLDPGGHEARRFGATTSGHVVVYSASGEERFAGGITPARGHMGDGPGRKGLIAALGGEQRLVDQLLPVFGCSLEDP